MNPAVNLAMQLLGVAVLMVFPTYIVLRRGMDGLACCPQALLDAPVDSEGGEI